MKSSIRRRPRNQVQTPVPLASGYNKNHIFNLGAGFADREQMLRQYGKSGTVYSIVSLLSQAAATPKWHLYKSQPVDGRRRYSIADMGDDQRTEVVNTAPIKLLTNPNPFMSRFEFFEASNQHLWLTGEFYWVLDCDAGFPTSMWVVRPDRMDPVQDPNSFISGWVYTGPGGEQIPLKVSEVIQERLPDPLDPYRGSSPVASIMPNIEQQRYATEYMRNMFINGADPGGIITVPSKLTEREFDEFTDRWRESHQGVARAGRIGILENGAQWVNAIPNNKDMEYSNLRLQNRDEIREAFRMPKSMLGTVEDVNRANAQTSAENFVTWSVLPLLNRRRETLNSKLLALFGATGQGIEFDYDDPSPVNQEAAVQELLNKSTAAQLLINAGLDPTDVLKAVGLPDMAVAEKATQYPALPPSWVAEPPAPLALPAGGTTPAAVTPGANQDDDQNALALSFYNKSAAAKVFKQVANDYPPDAMAWMHNATWIGPVKVPVDHIDPEMSWLDPADPHHVADFVKQIHDGKKISPIILVKVPGDNKLKLADGHHRYLAQVQEGITPKAYIGTVTKKHGEWEDMHAQQIDSDKITVANVLLEGLRPYASLEAVFLNRSRP